MEWLNYHHLYYFWLVCREGGFSKAAAKLRIAQSAVSHQIAQLEDFLGEPLMERSTRGFKLTEAGQVALAEADQIFRHGNDLVQYFRSGQMRAHFRIGALGGLSKNLQLKILSPIIAQSGAELTLEVGDADSLRERLLAYELDAVLSDFTFSASESEPLVQKQIMTEPICLISRSKARTDLSNLLKNGVFLPAKGSPVTTALLEHFRDEDMKVHIRGYIDDIAFLRLLALESDAAVAIPKIGVQRELQSKALSVLHEFRKIKQNYYLICRQKGKRHPLMASLAK